MTAEVGTASNLVMKHLHAGAFGRADLLASRELTAVMA